MASSATKLPPIPPEAPRLRLYVLDDDDIEPATQRPNVSTGSILDPGDSSETEITRLPCWGDIPMSAITSLKPLGRLTVRQVYEQHLLESRRKRLAKRTIEGELTTVLSRWEEFGSSSPKRWFVDQFNEPDFEPLGEPVENPPIGWITKQDLERFVSAQIEDGYPVGSIPSTVASLCAWFQELRPRSAGGLGAMYIVPRIKSKDLPIEPKRMPEWSEIEALWKHSSTEYRALIAFVLLLGFRCSDVQSLTFDAFSDDGETCSWMVQKSRRKRPHPQHFPVHPCLQSWMTSLRKKCSRGKLFKTEARPFQFVRDEMDFRKRWRINLTKAGLSERTTTHSGHHVEWLTLHALRRKCNEIFQDHHAGAGAWLLGHSIAGKDSSAAGKDSFSSSVNERHYTRVYQPLPSVREAILSAPIPEWLWLNRRR